MSKKLKFNVVSGSRSNYPNKDVLLIATSEEDNLEVGMKYDASDDEIYLYYPIELVGQLEGRVGKVDKVEYEQDDFIGYEKILKGIRTDKYYSATYKERMTGGKSIYYLLEEAETERVVTSVDSYDDHRERIVVKENILSEKEFKERLDYMLKNKLKKIQIDTIFNSYRKYPKEIAKRIANPSTKYIDGKNLLNQAIGYANIKRNLLFEGERGVGKNVLAETLSWVYNRPLYEFSLNSQLDNSAYLGSRTFKSEDDWSKKEKEEFVSSVKKLLSKTSSIKSIFSWFKSDSSQEVEESMKTVKQLSKYLTGQQEIIFEPSTIIESAMFGGILVLDEVNTALGHALSVFNSLLDERRRINVEGFKSVEADDNFFTIATMNRDYKVVFELNEAFEDRFEMMKFPPLDSIKGIIKSKVPKVSNKTLKIADHLFKKIKKDVKDGYLDSHALTIRGFISASMVIEQGVNFEDALITSVANKAKNKDDINVITEYIKDMEF